ncbi:TetR/AcrR family transcriptional regulator [Vulgatibacter sp.]|uniref:TetR/AcrR family transcriptional regulator n=1 Tax=Vulgatibacter sp. TaxID=1971226 RepID=UPI0035695DD0
MAFEEQDRGSARRERRRQEIARACLERFAEEGWAEARLDALADDAAMSKQGLLFYFRDKADLWAEAVTCAAEEIARALARRVTGERGPAAVRALRRGLDEVARVLPATFSVFLDASGSVPRASAVQQGRSTATLDALLLTLATALAADGGSREAARRLAGLAWLTLLAHHREARAASRAGLAAATQHPADLDYAEAQLVVLAGSLARSRT